MAGETGEERRGKFDEPVRTKKFGVPAKTHTNPQEVGWRKSGACEKGREIAVTLKLAEMTGFPGDSRCAPHDEIRVGDVGDVGEVGREAHPRSLVDDDAHPSTACAVEEQEVCELVARPPIGRLKEPLRREWIRLRRATAATPAGPMVGQELDEV